MLERARNSNYLSRFRLRLVRPVSLASPSASDFTPLSVMFVLPYPQLRYSNIVLERARNSNYHDRFRSRLVRLVSLASPSASDFTPLSVMFVLLIPQLRY